MNAIFTLTGWKNFIKSQCGYLQSRRLRYVALQFLDESGMDINEAIEWFENNINHPSARECGFNPYVYIDELKHIRAQRQDNKTGAGTVDEWQVHEARIEENGRQRREEFRNRNNNNER